MGRTAMRNIEGSLLKLMTCSIVAMSLVLTAAFPSLGQGSAESKGAPFTASQVCGRCHQEIYDYWQKSMHRHAADDPVFYAAYLEAYKITEGGAKYICTGCHAPTTLLTEDYAMESELSREGVTCDFCHSVKSLDLDSEGFPFTLEVGKVKRGPLRLKQKVFKGHEVEYSQLHTDSSFCAGCHEYRNEHGVLVLSTYSEWSQSPYAREGKSCQFCHMAKVPGKITVSTGEEKEVALVNRHDVSGSHSIPMLKKALEISIREATRIGKELHVVVDVTNKGSGHMIPTGIPSRMLVLEVGVRTDRGLVLTDRRIYKKTLLDEEGNEITRDSMIFIKSASIALDNRLRPKETRRENFTFFISRGEPVEVKAGVSYLYKPLLLDEQRMEVEMTSDTTRVPK